MTAILVAALAYTIGWAARSLTTKPAINASYLRGYCAGETRANREAEIEIDHLRGELQDTEQRLNAAVHAVTALPGNAA